MLAIIRGTLLIRASAGGLRVFGSQRRQIHVCGGRDPTIAEYSTDGDRAKGECNIALVYGANT